MGSHGRDDPQPAKIINVISVNSVKDKKRKVREATESWMNILISFPAISSKDVSEEPLIVEAEVEGYLVRRVYVDEGSSVEVMFEHCFENLNPKIKAGLRETQTDLVGFAGEISKPLGRLGKKTNERGRKSASGKDRWQHNRRSVGQPMVPGPASDHRRREPSDMTGVPRRVIEHMLNVNPSLDPVCQKRRTFSIEKSGMVTNKVAEWVKDSRGAVVEEAFSEEGLWGGAYFGEESG
ncbi:hypothetical protein Tco_0772620 [Tanacetum coccineum]|uniref:Reverse transcriptase domain-containing protein n=1 Tax=Tanacetum coccineum TaxID=301880 RepID=A0ABQ4ZIE8_9ASTR